MTLDMRTLYASYEEAVKIAQDPANKTALLQILQIIQNAAVIELSLKKQPICINFNTLYSKRNETRKTSEEVIDDLSNLIENITHHKLQWLQLEPNKTAIKAFLTNAEHFAESLFESLRYETTRTHTQQMDRLPSIPGIPRIQKRSDTIESLLAVMGIKSDVPGAQVIRRPKKTK